MGDKPRKPPKKKKPKGAIDTCEQDLIDHLRGFGCTITTSKKLDGEYKIDALVEALPDHEPGGPPIGMQISHQRRDLSKTRIFFERAAEWPGVGALLYAKLDLSWAQPATREMALAVLEVLTKLWDDKPKKRHARRKAFFRPDGTWHWMDVDA